MKHRALSILVTVALLLAFATPVFAITYGTFDGNSHPNVGSMALRIPGIGVWGVCTGTLVAEKVFLTASHCTILVDTLLARYPGSQMLVTFDPTISESDTFYTAQWVTNPAFIEHRYGASDTGDVGVGLLDVAPAGITPARLPTAGLLDQLKDNHTLNDTLFTAVGYGMIRETNHTGPQGMLHNVDRNRVDQGFLSLTDAWVTFSMNYATDNGGTCYGDSGGPHFIHMDGVETNIVVAVTVTGDRYCKATDKDYRLDTPNAREFLKNYLTLP